MHLIAKTRRMTDSCSAEENLEICWIQHRLNVRQFQDALRYLRQYDVIAVFNARNRWNQCIIVRPHLIVVSWSANKAVRHDHAFSVEKISAPPIQVLSVDYGFDYTFKVMRVPSWTYAWNCKESRGCRRYLFRKRRRVREKGSKCSCDSSVQGVGRTLLT